MVAHPVPTGMVLVGTDMSIMITSFVQSSPIVLFFFQDWFAVVKGESKDGEWCIQVWASLAGRAPLAFRMGPGHRQAYSLLESKTSFAIRNLHSSPQRTHFNSDTNHISQFLAHNAFVRTNRHAIAVIFVRLSVWHGRAL